MSNDLVRSNGAPNWGPPSTQLAQQDAWIQQQALAVAGAPNAEIKPLQLVHRSLRGRYKVAALAAVIGAIIGGALGLKSQVQTYRATGAIHVKPYVRLYYGTSNTSGSIESTPMYESMMNTLAANLRGDTMLAERAMQMPKWKDLIDQKAVPPTMSPAAFLRNVQTSFTPKTLFVRVSFDSADSRIAIAGAGALVEAYKLYGLDESVKAYTDNVDMLRKSIDEAERKIADNRRKIDEELSEHGARNLQPRIDDLRQQLKLLNVNHRQQNLILDRMKTLKDSPAPVDPQVLAQIDPMLGQFANDLAIKTNDYERNRAQGMMENNPTMQILRRDIDRLTKIINDKTAKLGGQVYGTVSDLSGNQILVTEAKLQQQIRDVEDLKVQIEELESETSIFEDLDYTVATMRETNVALQDGIERDREKILRLDAILETIPTQIEPKAPFSAEVSEDKRMTMAVFGAVLGAGIPLCIVFARGLMDRRVRYSDEATGSADPRGGIPMLGVLPNLPDRLSDPSQASVAAHCVHQIRTMLQLNAIGDECAILSVTSATSGDGKTSLTLALGLSFAASGSRTLLIDTDLIGAGLSARLGIREPQGITQAISSREPMAYVRETDVAELSVLPVGLQGQQNADTFSPAAVRRMFAELRKHFDVILLDTGPVLGSIEATPVVAASDATILTVARGQDRTMVEKAIAHIRSVGGRLAGFVFNRAATKDFEKTISGISLRSVSRAVSRPEQTTTTANPARVGPLVRSVQEGRNAAR